MKTFLKILLSLFIIAVVIVIAAAILGDDTETANPSDSISDSAEETQEENKDHPVVYEDDMIRAKFVSIEDVDALPGNAFMRLIVENKSDKNIKIAFQDCAINKTTIQTITGMTIAAGEQSREPILFALGNIGIEKAEDVSEISFRFYIMDDSHEADSIETERITIKTK